MAFFKTSRWRRAVATVAAGLSLTQGPWAFAGDAYTTQPSNVQRVSAEFYDSDEPGTAVAKSERIATATATDEPSFYPREGRMRYAAGRMTVMQDPVAPAPVQPAAQFTPETSVRTASLFGDIQFDQAQIQADLPATTQSQIATGAPNDFVLDAPQTAFVLNTRDAGSLLERAPSTTNISLFDRRSITDPHIRGFDQRQFLVQMDGGQWRPARMDLDTIVSKIDSGIVQDMVVIKGPYSAMYGPGLAFLDVVTVGTPRACAGGGLVFDGRTLLTYDTNGQGWYGRQGFSGGGTNWGFRVSNGIRSASDYDSGNGTSIRSSYKQNDIDFALGYDFSEYSRLEINYVRLDVGGMEFYNQPTDLDWLVTNGFTGRYQLDYTELFDHLTVTGYYNRTREAQDNGGFPRPVGIFTFDPMNNPIQVADSNINVSTYANQESWGYRSGLTWGDFDTSHLTIGTDLRHRNNRLTETSNFDVTQVLPPGAFFDLATGEGRNTFNDLPDARLVNPGLFIQSTDYLTDRLSVTLGGRYDYMHTDVGTSRPFVGFYSMSGFYADVPVTPNDRDFDMWSAFVTANYDLTDELQVFVGGGHGQRPPTLFELYSLAPFVAGNQRGFAAFLGNDKLSEEKMTQIDVGFRANYANMRGSIRGFYGWCDDYITYNFGGTHFGLLPTTMPPTSALIRFAGFEYTNRNAILAGFELNGDFDITDWLTAFGNIAYTEGRDRILHEPLYGIFPLQSRAGLRAYFGDNSQGFGLEFLARMIDNQDRVAASLGELTTPGYTVFDMRAYIRVTQNLLLTGGCLNFTDKNYFNHYDYRDAFEGTPSFQIGRNFYFGTELVY